MRPAVQPNKHITELCIPDHAMDLPVSGYVLSDGIMNHLGSLQHPAFHIFDGPDKKEAVASCVKAFSRLRRSKPLWVLERRGSGMGGTTERAYVCVAEIKRYKNGGTRAKMFVQGEDGRPKKCVAKVAAKKSSKKKTARRSTRKT